MREGIVHLLNRSRASVVELAMVGVLLAIGVNMASGALPDVADLSPCASLLIGCGLSVVALAYLGFRLLSQRVQHRICQATFVYDVDENCIIPIPGYDFAESLAHYVRGALAENPAFKAIWDKEPLSLIPTLVWGKSEGEREIPEAMDMVSEAVEYFILSKLSTRLADYFSDESFRNTYVKTYQRADLSAVLLSNRFLELFSKPMRDRPRFVEQPWHAEDDLVAFWNEDGTLYERFDLVLPTRTTIARPKPHAVEIATNRFRMTIAVDYGGFSANLPRGFAEYYLGIEGAGDDGLPIRYRPFLVYASITVEFRFGALLLPTGWEYHRWVDGFLNTLEDTLSVERFMSAIGWETVHALLMSLRHSRHTD